MKKLYVSVSAVPLSRARDYLKNFKRHYPELFNKLGSGRKKDRIYIPLRSGDATIERKPPLEISEYLSKLGYDIENYKLGLARNSKGKTVKIGKLLKDEELAKQFMNDPARNAAKSAAEGQLVVISRHPYDLIGSSFDRGWTSCMNIRNGAYHRHIRDDIRLGTLVAYLVKLDDKNINKPIARCLIKPFYDYKEQMVLVADGVYGTAPKQFLDTVLEFVSEFNKGAPDGIYFLQGDLYNDGTNTVVFGKPNFEHIKALAPSNKRSIAATTRDRSIISWCLNNKIEGITANRNLTHSDFEKALDFENEETFAKNCPHEDLVFRIPDIDYVVDNYAGKVRDKANVRAWLINGGDTSQVSKVDFVSYVNSLPVNSSVLKKLSKTSANVTINDVGFADVPNLVDFIKLAKIDSFGVPHLLLNRFSKEVKREMLEYCAESGKTMPMIGFAILVKDEANMKMLEEVFAGKFPNIKNLEPVFEQRLAEHYPFYKGRVLKSKVDESSMINLPADFGSLLEDVAENDKSLLDFLKGMQLDTAGTAIFEKLMGMLPKEKWHVMLEADARPSNDKLLEFILGIDTEKFLESARAAILVRAQSANIDLTKIEEKFAMSLDELKSKLRSRISKF